MKLTPSQIDAIRVVEPPVDTCAVAGPGSGKTTVLVERFRALVESGIRPNRILAITFTEKAAYEMQARLGKCLGAANDLRVGTVHGFCARLLRENAIRAGIDPQFRILEEHEADAIERSVVRETLDELVAGRPGEMWELLGWLAAPDLGDAVRDIYETLRASGSALSTLRTEPPAATEVFAEILDYCDRISAARVFDWSATQREQWRNVLDWGARLRAIAQDRLSEAHLDLLNQFDCKLNRIKRDGEASTLMRKLKNERIPAAQSVLVSAVHQPRRQMLVDAIEQFDAVFRERKHNMGGLDFSDLEELTVRLLESDARVRDQVSEQFDHILMDEFQDTNGVQSALLQLLRRPGRFYAVGDINQAIYGFRHADSEVFRRFRETAGHVAELRENWRSRPDILRAALTILDGAKGIEPHPLVAARAFAVDLAPVVEVIPCQRIDQEAQWVARRIAELRPGQGSYSDFALLFRSTAPMPVFAQALEAEGVPFAVNAGRGFWEQQEVMDLVNLLRVSANSLDEVSRAAVLRSPLFGLPDDALLLLKEGGRLSIEDRERIDRFETNLARYRRLPPDRILLHAMDETAYEAGLSVRARANVEKLIELVRRPGISLGELVDQLNVYRAADPREADTAIDTDLDAVRLQTIHAAKGLEFPVVFLPALHGGVQSDVPPVAFLPGSGMGVRWRNPATTESASDAIHGLISPEIRRKQAEEADRLLYVAMTRAEGRLVLSFSGATHWAGLVTRKLKLDMSAPGETRHIEVRAPDGVVFPVRLQCVTSAPPAWGSETPAASAAFAAMYLDKPAISGQYEETASVTAVAQFAHCPRRYHLERTVVGPQSAPRRVSGTIDLGLQVHALLAGASDAGAPSEAVALAERFRQSELGRRAARTLLAEKEFDFMLAVEDIVLSGRIDLWFEENGETILVDYKTEEADAATESHQLQIRLYAMALERMTGKPVDAAYVYLLRQNVAQLVDCGTEAIADAVAQVRRFRDAQEAGSFPLREGQQCLRCPFFRSQCPASV